ncbi:hypothetical protein [Treponema sp. OMZ 857]|uniref:hypothetical protein n=1 Tax=Treponema sp. OMZ 857 TaxID=1643513 RepID=UPI0020A459A6|nr:hypothetical protein [Treponema sp. OMZ 857]UTC44263.1 hypothetical protein E4N66_09400 [Treponema sp. OMZ 857]
MKKQYVNSVSILLAMLCLAFTACNGMLTGGDTGTVRVVIGGGTARSVDGKGLPALNENNTVITITDEEGTELARKTTSVTVTLAIGTKITVKAVVTTAAGAWHGSEKHTVTAGDNFIAVKLSKTLKVAANLLFYITGKDPSGSNIVSLSTQNGRKLLDGILIGKKPVTARDKIGRIYVLYEDTSSTHLKRFNVEGNEDTEFEAALAAVLPSGVVIGSIDNIVIDQDDNYIFLLKEDTVYCFKEKEDHSFESFSSAAFPSAPASSASAVAVDDDVLFAVYGQTLSACEFGFEDLPTPGNKTLKFKSTTLASQNLNQLRSASAFGNDLPDCTGLFAEDDDVYCLLTQQKEEAGKKYALGQLVRYEYSGSTLTKKNTEGLHSKAGSTDLSLPFESASFSNPVGFIGYDEDNIYIADDGVNIEYLNENLRVNGNQDRIAAFNRRNGSLSFRDSGATWFTEHAVYKKPNTKILLWEKQSPAMVLSPMNYWISTDGTEAFSATNKLFEDSVQPTDVFCYDQDGNLYILWKDSSGCNVRRFALKEDGSYDTQGVDAFLTPHDVSAIAVDISDGQNSLYYTYADGPSGHIVKYNWSLGSSFNSGSGVSGYDVPFNPDTAPVTALAANKDGLFVGTRARSTSPDGYTLSVKKYDKQDGADKGTIDVGSFQETPTEPTSPPFDPYTNTIAFVNDLQVLDGVLYAITSKEEYGMKETSFDYQADTFKNSGKLYKIGSTKDGFSGSAVELAKKDPVDTAGNEVGYGFYRFIAVKYDEAERIRLIIASDGAWGKDGTVISPEQPYCKNVDKVLEYDLKGRLQSERDSGGGFSKLLQESGFEWN